MSLHYSCQISSSSFPTHLEECVMSWAMQDLYVNVRLISCHVHLPRHFTPTLLSCPMQC